MTDDEGAAQKPTPDQIRAIRGDVPLRTFAPTVGIHWMTWSRWELGKREPTGLYLGLVQRLVRERREREDHEP